MIKLIAFFPALKDGLAMRRRDYNTAQAFRWQAPTDNVEAALEMAFREFNVVEEDDSHIDRKCRSMGVGDLIIVKGDGYYICDLSGWSKVDRETAKRWINIPYSQRCLGFQKKLWGALK